MTATKRLWFYAFILMGAMLIAISGCNKDEDENGQHNTVTDIDGNVYKTVKIGNQEWMAENLRVTRYNNGNPVPTGLSDMEWDETEEGAWAIYPHGYIDGLNTDEEVLAAYGALYNWHALNDSRDLCPAGWRVPTDEEWTVLVDYVVAYGYPNELNNPDGTGNALKSCRQVRSPLGGECATSEHPRWDSHGTHYGTDKFGFSALPAGYRLGYRLNYDDSFLYIGYYGFWWSSSEYSSTSAWYRYMNVYYGNVTRPNYSKTLGLSLRCVRDVD